MPDQLDNIVTENGKVIDRIQIIYRVIGGSQSYGLDVETSDTDFRSVYVLPPDRRVGLNYVEQFKAKDGDDVYCDVSQLFRHMTAGAPNWVEVLYVEPRFVVVVDPVWHPVIESRDLFLTKRLVTKSLGFIEGMVQRSHRQIETDGKTLMHGVRMARSILSLLDVGYLQVHRSADRDELLAIRDDAPKARAKARAECEESILEIRHKLVKSTLPDEPDEDKINRLLVNVILQKWREQGWV